jgi:predicted Zn-dependent peptidase
MGLRFANDGGRKRQMAELTRLANGLTVAIDPMPGAQSAAIGLHAFVGSRSEPEGKGGLAHLVEHMVFKGARGRDARAIAEAIEDVGGSLNAWTSRDQTLFHARTLAADVGLALELIADLVRAPKLDGAELEREKLVILSELGECLDAPDDLIHDRLFEAAFGDQALARPVLGTEQSINGLAREDCVQWLGDQYRPERLVISAAGKVDAGHVLLLAEALFGDLEAGAPPAIAPAIFVGGTRSDRRSAEQTHLALAYRGLAASDAAAPALSLFAQAVGGGMSSRLFQELREDRGLAYSIYAWTQGFAETGMFAVNLAAEKARATEALNLAREVVERAAEELSDGELNRARAQIEASILMAMETPQGRADAMARSIEIFGRIMTSEEMLAELHAVDVAAARAAGQAMLEGPRAIASIGGKLALAA